MSSLSNSLLNIRAFPADIKPSDRTTEILVQSRDQQTARRVTLFATLEWWYSQRTVSTTASAESNYASVLMLMGA